MSGRAGRHYPSTPSQQPKPRLRLDGERLALRGHADDMDQHLRRCDRVGADQGRAGGWAGDVEMRDDAVAGR